MPEYLLYSQNEEGGAQVSWTLDCRDDEERRDIPEGVLASGPLKIIEVWRDRTMIHRSVKPAELVHLYPRSWHS